MAVLVTGATGFVAQWVVDYLLKENYEIIGTVRSQEKADKLHRQFGNLSNLSFEIVTDISDPVAFEPLFKKRGEDIDIVLHIALPHNVYARDYEKDILIPVVNSTKGLLNAIKTYGDVKKIVMTSSFLTVFDVLKFGNEHAVFTEKDWNPVTWEDCQTDCFSAYSASKKFAEEVAWEFASETGVDLSTINPVIILGPQKFDEDVKPYSDTYNKIVDYLLHTKPGDKIVPKYIPCYIDVRDVAKAHLVAIQKDTAGERLGLWNDGFFTQDILNILNEKFPQLRGEIAEGKDLRRLSTGFHATIDTTHTKEILGFTFTSLEQSVYDAAVQILKKEGRM
ncbi:hypothetical protein ZYGR_0AK00110 [Zygosaccharomyces rouxii]|uniref:NAD-dependent epimerase/dehydratase domain-containing protein n=1 Tax=Zygosaccharomyces rouxii TaxID=4956 RepID=A0A1Q3ACL3_ZYGRO|nr:hypothetical protein ZYGR_0AK00110 [Zygosaccharomyces rouxii]